MTDIKARFTVGGAINEYYKLKHRYEQLYKTKHVDGIITSHESKNAKRIAFSKLPKPSCINCKRPVGTLFSLKGDINAKTFKAVCGDLTNPCPLNINILYSVYPTYRSMIRELQQDEDRLMLDIIKTKNKLMFLGDELTDATYIAKLDTLTDKLTEITELLGSTIELNILDTENPTRFDLLRKELANFDAEYVVQFKSFITEFEKTANEEYIREAVKFYVEQLAPKAKFIRELKYAVNNVVLNNDTNIYHLEQKRNTLASQEFNVNDDNKINTFIVGLKNKNKTQKATKLTKSNTTTKTKTKKMQPIFIVADDIDANAADDAASSANNEDTIN